MNRIAGNSQLMIVFLLLATIIASCKKDHTVPRDTPFEKELVVNFQNTLLSVNEIDSANVVFRKNGAGTPIFQRFDKSTNTLHTITDGLSTGQWVVEIDMYTKKGRDGKSFEYVVSKTITLAKETGKVELKAPVNLDADGWKKHLVLSTSDNALVVVIPMDVTNPYFEIRAKNVDWNFFGVERTAIFGTAVVAYKSWQCQQGCLRSDRLLFDKDIFKPFTDQIKTKAWHRNDIMITIGNTATQQYNEFNYSWAR